MRACPLSPRIALRVSRRIPPSIPRGVSSPLGSNGERQGATAGRRATGFGEGRRAGRGPAATPPRPMGKRHHPRLKGWKRSNRSYGLDPISLVFVVRSGGGIDNPTGALRSGWKNGTKGERNGETTRGCNPSKRKKCASPPSPTMGSRDLGSICSMSREPWGEEMGRKDYDEEGDEECHCIR